jgi:nitrogen fixation NifU-like protein
MDSNLKRTLMLENYEKPLNKGLLKDAKYISGNKNNSSCIDNFDIELLIENGVIKDIRFDGEACAIATSSMSISIGILIGKTKEEALKIIENYENMIDEKEYDKDLIRELNAYDEIYKQPARKKCATLGILGIKDLINQSK